MTQKKTRRTRRTEEESGFISETVRKSKLTASNEFELKKLVRSQKGFLNCTMEYDAMGHLVKAERNGNTDDRI